MVEKVFMKVRQAVRVRTYAVLIRNVEARSTLGRATLNAYQTQPFDQRFLITQQNRGAMEQFKLEITIEAKDAEDACYRVLGWQSKFVKEALVSTPRTLPTIYVLARRGYEQWEPCWRPERERE